MALQHSVRLRHLEPDHPVDDQTDRQEAHRRQRTTEVPRKIYIIPGANRSKVRINRLTPAQFACIRTASRLKPLLPIVAQFLGGTIIQIGYVFQFASTMGASDEGFVSSDFWG